MRILRVLTAVLCLVVTADNLAIAQSQQRAKVAEGKYGKFRDGKLIGDADQTWVLWRGADGKYDLEDRFHLANPAAELLAAVGSDRLSAQLQQKMQGEVAQTELDVGLSAELKPEHMTLKGTRLLDGKTADIATCIIGEQEIKCKGMNGGAKLTNREAHEFLCSFPFPMLLGALLKRESKVLGARTPLNLSVLSLEPYNKPKIKFANCGGDLTLVGKEQVQLGDRTYNVDKYVLDVHSKVEPLKLTLWLNQTLVVGMEVAGISGERLQLVEYKKYSEF
jgi:hypothetical protein